MLTIHRVHVLSALRIGVLLGGLSFAVLGLLAAPIGLLALDVLRGFGGSIQVITPGGGTSLNNLVADEVVLASGLTVACVLYIGGVVAASIAGGVGLALLAFIYNLSARWIGGLQVEAAATASHPLDDTLL